MKKYNCPTCGAEVIFKSNVSVYAVCKYCSSMIVRHDIDVEAIGVMATLPDDMSPLQLGTEGKYLKKHFGLIGRLKIAWAAGVWNEWYLISDDGQNAWLGEAQGSYAINFELEEGLDKELEKELRIFFTDFENLEKDTAQSYSNSAVYSLIQPFASTSNPNTANNTSTVPESSPEETDSTISYSPNSSLRLGSCIDIGKLRLKIIDIKQTTCIGSEGELPFSAPKGRKAIAIDLVGTSKEFATIELCEGEITTYLGTYVEWDDLSLTNTRQLEGW